MIFKSIISADQTSYSDICGERGEVIHVFLVKLTSIENYIPIVIHFKWWNCMRLTKLLEINSFFLVKYFWKIQTFEANYFCFCF